MGLGFPEFGSCRVSRILDRMTLSYSNLVNNLYSTPTQRAGGSSDHVILCTIGSCTPVTLIPELGSPAHGHSQLGHIPIRLLKHYR